MSLLNQRSFYLCFLCGSFFVHALLHVLSLELCDFLTIVLVEGYIVVADEVVALLAGSFRSFAIAPLEPGEHRLTDVDTTVVHDVCLDYLVAVSLHNLGQ